MKAASFIVAFVVTLLSSCDNSYYRDKLVEIEESVTETDSCIYADCYESSEAAKKTNNPDSLHKIIEDLTSTIMFYIEDADYYVKFEDLERELTE